MFYFITCILLALTEIVLNFSIMEKIGVWYRPEDIDLLLSQLKIEEVVGEFVELKKTGANYKGLCPFHNDTSPSFMVNPAKNICKCFVCGAGGNPITFYEKYKKITFSEAVGELAAKYKIDIKGIASNSSTEEKYDRLYKIMEEAHEYFKENIFSQNSRDAMEYLSKRGLDPKTITDHGLGYASKKWSELTDLLISKGYTIDDLVSLGLSREGEKGNYDFFRQRIMFPIYSTAKKIIAFGGRTIEQGKDIPKYINTQDTPIFKKGKNLYGLERGNIIKKKNYAILMEGYMDVLSACDFGFDTTLAPLGTALTEDQGSLLKKYTSNVFLSFDSDGPGQMATEKAGLILESLGFKVKVLQYTGAKDPDEFLKAYGKKAFLEVVKNSLEFYDFIYKYYSKDYNLEDTFAKENFIKRFKPFFTSVNNNILERSICLDKLSKSLSIDKDILEAELITGNTDILKKENTLRYEDTYTDDERSFAAEKEIVPLEKETLNVILSSKNAFGYFEQKEAKGTFTKKVFNYLADHRDMTELEIIKELRKLDIFTDNEKIILDDIVCHAISEFKNKKELDEKIAEVYKSWFREELKNYKKNRISLEISMQILKIEDKLRDYSSIQELKKLYDDFYQLMFKN